MRLISQLAAVTLGLIVLGFGTASAGDRPGVLFLSNFESGVLSDASTSSTSEGWARAGSMPTISTEEARIGKYSMKAYLNKNTSPTPYRTMVIASWATTTDTSNRAAPGVPFFQDSWIGFSLFLPKEGAGNWLTESNTYEDLVQWHDGHNPWPPPAWDTEESKNPLFAIFVSDNNHLPSRHWNLSYIGESRTPYPTTGSPRPWKYESNASIDLGPIDPDLGVWTDFVIRIRWNFWKVGSKDNTSPMNLEVHDNLAGSSNCGLIQVWKNGKLVLDRSPVQIGSHDSGGPTLSVGVYKGWRTQPQRDSDKVVDRTVYFDEFRYGGADATYASVAPAGGTVPKPPSDLRTHP